MTFAAREHHRFESAGKPFVYLVPSAAIFELDEAADRILQALADRPRSAAELTGTEVAGGDGGWAYRPPVSGVIALPIARLNAGTSWSISFL